MRRILGLVTVLTLLTALALLLLGVWAAHLCCPAMPGMGL